MISAALAVLENDEQRNELSEFYERNKNRFFMIAYSKLHNARDAEDAVQEAFMRIADKPQKFFSIECNKRVAYTDVIIRNISFDMFKKKTRVTEEELTDDIAYENTGIEDTVIGKLSRDELIELIRALPQRQKSVLEMKAVYGFSTPEIAERLGIKENAVKMNLFRAKGAIKKAMESEHGNE